MERIDARRLSDILAASPVWARLALTAPDERLRERGADTLAAIVLSKLEEPAPPTRDKAQLALPIV